MSVLAASVLLLASALALAACGDEAATGASDATLPPGSGPSASPSPDVPSVTPADGTRMAASYESPPYYPSEAVGTPTVGWVFRPKVGIKVTELGCYDADQDGLEQTHRVGIFDARTDRLLASVKVGPGSALDGAFRWESLARPLILRAGHPYAVGTTADPMVEGAEAGHETMYQEGSEQWAPEIHFGGLRTNLGSRVRFSAPTNRQLMFGMGKVAWMSPNFKFRPVEGS